MRIIQDYSMYLKVGSSITKIRILSTLFIKINESECFIGL